MSKSLEFFFDVGSPTTYLAWTQLPKIAADAGATIIWRPMLLGGVFKATGNQSPVNIPAKARYMLQDLARYARRYGVPMTFNPHFPINTLTPLRGAAGYLDTPQFATYVTAIFNALWVEQKNPASPKWWPTYYAPQASTPPNSSPHNKLAVIVKARCRVGKYHRGVGR